PLIRGVTVRLFEELTSRGVRFEEMSTVATPRRVAVSVRGLADGEPERESLEFGPATSEAFDEDGSPTPVLRAFSERLGVDIDALEPRPTERGEVLAHVDVAPGRAMMKALESLVPRLLKEASARLDKVGGDLWPRPVTGVLALLDGDIVPFTFGEPAGRRSAGHPVFSPEPFDVEDWDDYCRLLADRGLVGGLDERRRQLEERAVQRATELGGAADGLPVQIARWAASCEIPAVIDGELPQEALGLPVELLRTVLAERQDAVAVRRGADVLPFFLAVMDRPEETGSAAREGRRRAVAGDLLDALFDYERDRAVPLVERARRLEQLTFQGRLGTYAEKSFRLRELVALACDELGWHDATEHALEAASLAKADLTTAAVGAYPELQGVIGGVMARSEGYVEPVWQAIYDHSLPRAGAGDAMPRGRVGHVLAVADRLGTLVGLFGVHGDAVDADGRTGRGDPRRLRPLAAGLLRLIIDGEMPLDLDLLVARAVLLYGERLELDAEAILRRLQSFLDRRLDHYLGAAGFGAAEIEAAKAVGTADLPDLVRRLEGLRAMRGSSELRQLVQTARRIGRIVEGAPEGEIAPELLADGAESDLFDGLVRITPAVEAASAAGAYDEVLKTLAELLPTLDRFFIEVLVNDEDEATRTHRLALLQTARRLGGRVARLANLEPDEHAPAAAEAPNSDPARIPPWLASRSSKTD
ncbi:MAG: glycine--tRNA ligase subunit beta, partial [Acidobacteriota bacterium]